MESRGHGYKRERITKDKQKVSAEWHYSNFWSRSKGQSSRADFIVRLPSFKFRQLGLKQKSFHFDNALDNEAARLNGQKLKHGKGEMLKRTGAESEAETIPLIVYTLAGLSVMVAKN